LATTPSHAIAAIWRLASSLWGGRRIRDTLDSTFGTVFVKEMGL
jgi:hypothetical protein